MIHIPSCFKVIENAKGKGKCRVIRPVLKEEMTRTNRGGGGGGV